MTAQLQSQVQPIGIDQIQIGIDQIRTRIEKMDNGNLEISSDQLFFRIGQVCRLTDIKPFTLRYWESEFPTLAPVKSPKGHRLYRREDVQTVLRIKRLLYDEGFTIAGARRYLRDADAGPAQQPLAAPSAPLERSAPAEAGDDAARDAASDPSHSPRRDELSPLRADAAADRFEAEVEARVEARAESPAAPSSDVSAPQPAAAANMLSRKLLLDLRDSLRAFLTLLENE